MPSKEIHIPLEPIERAVSKVGSVAHDVLSKIDEGIEHNRSPKNFYDARRAEESSHVQATVETVVYEVVSHLVAPFNAVSKVIEGETLHGHPVSKLDRVKAAGDLAVTVLKLPRTAKVAYELTKVGADIYKATKSK